MASVDLAAGSIFAARYRIVGRIASGGMGAVYEVVHLETRRRRALKVMLPELFQKPELRDRFRREAHVTASVKSEFLVDVFDAGLDESSGMPFLVMELLEGEDLGRLVDREGALAPSDVALYLSQVASALDRTHAASIVHRDLKPENLFLTHRDDGSPCIKILDFGISKIMNEAAAGGPNTTSIGTPAYMAPEQIVGGPVSPAADLHALGLIAYTLLTGRAYWQDDVESTDNALAFALRAAQGIREGAVSRANRHGHALPKEFDAWFSRAVDLDPKRRFASASEAVRGLVEALGLPPETMTPSPASVRRDAAGRAGANAPSPRSDKDVPSTMHGAELGPTHRKPTTLVRWLAAGAVLAFVGIAVATFWTTGHPRPTDPSLPPAADDRKVAPAQNAIPTPAPIVAPVEGSPETAPQLPSAAPPLAAKQAATPAAGKHSGSAAKPPSTETAPAASPTPAASAAPASATASFPVAGASASARPKPKYTRD
jgi:serine/threonine-protein kinase